MAKGSKKKKINSKKKVSKSIRSSKIEKISPDEITVKQPNSPTLVQQLRLGESYVSLVLGAFVVLILSILFFIFLRGNSGNNLTEIDTILPSAMPTQVGTPGKTHVVAAEETLWDIAVKYYGDGFRYVDIIEANKFENPDYVPPGTKIIIPDAK